MKHDMICFKLSLIILFSLACVAVTNEENKVCVREGDRAELNPDVGELQRDALILWLFGPENNLIAKADLESYSASTYDGADGRFTDRLKLDLHTASLSITNITNTHSGLYKLKIMSSRETKYQQFRVKVSGKCTTFLSIIIVYCNMILISSFA